MATIIISKHVKFISSLPQKWLQERISMLRYTHAKGMKFPPKLWCIFITVYGITLQKP